MSAQNNLNRYLDMLKPAHDFWQQCQPRERRMLTLCGLVLGLALIYAVLFEPAWHGRQQLQKRLPQLREQAAQLQSLLAQAAALPAPSDAPSNTVLLPLNQALLEESLKQKGLSAKNLAITADAITLELADISFANVIEWLDEIQKTARWHVSTAAVQAHAGLVNAKLSLVPDR